MERVKTNDYGEVIVDVNDVFESLYAGNINSLDHYRIDNQSIVEQFNEAVINNADSLSKLKVYTAPKASLEEFDKQNQQNWFMPKDYFPDLVEWIFNQCTTDEQVARVNQELELFIQHNMMDLLYYLKYLVDTMRDNKIVWGVGRGSSVASYVLYLIGVHKIDSIKYELDIHEFLK